MEQNSIVFGIFVILAILLAKILLTIKELEGETDYLRLQSKWCERSIKFLAEVLVSDPDILLEEKGGRK